MYLQMDGFNSSAYKTKNCLNRATNTEMHTSWSLVTTMLKNIERKNGQRLTEPTPLGSSIFPLILLIYSLHWSLLSFVLTALENIDLFHKVAFQELGPVSWAVFLSSISSNPTSNPIHHKPGGGKYSCSAINKPTHKYIEIHVGLFVQNAHEYKTCKPFLLIKPVLNKRKRGTKARVNLILNQLSKKYFFLLRYIPVNHFTRYV